MVCLLHLSASHYARKGSQAAMTDSETVQAASNDGGTTAKPKPAQRVHGMDRLREEECYYLAALIEKCLDEARYLVKKVYSKAWNRTLDHDGSKGTRPLDRAEARQILNEAFDCVSLALAYLYEASTHLRDADNQPDPLFYP
jgi:hypothetical protein